MYTFEAGQVYTLNLPIYSVGQSAPDNGTLEIEIVTVLPGAQGRVTFAVWELIPGTDTRTAQGSATVPISWLLVTLAAHRAELLTDGPARAEHLQSWLRFANSDGARWLADH